MSDCLTDEQVERYVVGLATAEQRRILDAHMRDCADCRARIERQKEREDLLAEVRQVCRAEGPLTPAPAEAAGELVPGYQILEELYRGGQGVVYKAVQRSTERVVAVKLLHGGPVASEPARKRFEREIRLAARLQHPHIVVIHDSGVADGCPYVVMDYVPGLRITEYTVVRGLSIADRLHLFAAVCEAVEYAHQQGVLHRDLKPSNILVTEQGEPVIVDFGLAREMRSAEQPTPAGTVTAEGQVLGSLPYLSPEQAAGDPSQIDERTDVYALGVLLYELLTGTCPPPVPIGSLSPGISPSSPSARPIPPSQACAGLDARLDSIVLKALEHDRKKRYRSAGDFAAVIRTYVERPVVSAWRQQPFLRRLGLVALLVYAVVATVTTVALIGLWDGTERSLKYGSEELAEVEERLSQAMIRRLFPEDRPGRDIVPYRIPVTWPKDYHGHIDAPEPLFKDDFDSYRFGLNPPLLPLDDEEPNDGWDEWNDGIGWEHFEGTNLPGSEGLSNLYVTGWWAASLPKALRARTGIARSARVNALNVWNLVKDAERFYYQCWVHIESAPNDALHIGFVADDPRTSDETNWSHAWTNGLTFTADGLIEWICCDAAAGRTATRTLSTWQQGREEVLFLRVELDFDLRDPRGFVWINGEAVGRDLSISRKAFKPKGWGMDEFRLERWAFAAPSTPAAEGLAKYAPRYTDIDDLQFGTWDYCWDLNRNAVGDSEEDINEDGVVDERDCQPTPTSATTEPLLP